MLGQVDGRQILQVGKVGALRLDLVHHLGQAVGQRRVLRERQDPTAIGAIPAPYQLGQQQLTAQGRDRGLELQSFRGGVEQQFVFVTVAQRLELRQQRRPTHHAREGIAETAGGTAGGQVDHSRRQRQGIIAGARDQPPGQRLRKGRAGGDGENGRVLQAG
jgi:hypothetical protein